MNSFTLQKMGAGNYTTRYTRAIQVMLLNYNGKTRDYINAGGGVDGKYGEKTAAAVKEYQQSKAVPPYDGECGTKTWTSLSGTLIKTRDNGAQMYYRFPLRATEIMYQIRNTSTWYCCVNGTWYYVG